MRTTDKVGEEIPSKKPENSDEKSSRRKCSTQFTRGLEAKLEKLKLKVGMGFEVNLKWLPGTVKHKNGKQLLEEVVGNTVFIYVEDLTEATYLLAHGFSEWLLNKHTKKYRLLINKLIELFEDLQYEEKEIFIDVMTKLLTEIDK